MTPEEEAQRPFPALAARAQREPPVRLCGGLCVPSPGCSASRRAEVGRREDPEEAEGKWGESARTWLLTPVRNVSD